MEGKYPAWIFWNPAQIPLRVDGIGCTETVVVDTGYPRFLARLKRCCTLESVWRQPSPMNSYYEIRTSINGHPIRAGWRVPRAIFEREFAAFQQDMARARAAWDTTPDAWKLVTVLRECFHRNLRAHANRPRPARWAAFDKKNDLLYQAIRHAGVLSLTSQLPFFSWGKQADPGTPHHPWILYFQFGPAQVSFHCNIPRAPDFPGQWIGYPQTECPISIAQVKKLLLKHHISLTALTASPDEYPSPVPADQLTQLLAPRMPEVPAPAPQPVMPRPRPGPRQATILEWINNAG